MKVFLTVTVCCFVLYAVPLPTNASVNKARLYDTLKSKITVLEYDGGLKQDLLIPGVSLAEALGLHDSIAKAFTNENKTEKIDFTPRAFDKSLPTWVVAALDGGNGINGVLSGIINQVLGGQTLIIVGRPQNEQELEAERKAMNDDTRFQRKLEITKFFNELLKSAKALGIPVIQQDEAINNLECLWEAFNAKYSDLKIEVVLDALFGKGFLLTEFLENAKPTLYVLKMLNKKYEQIWGVDGSSGANIFGRTVENNGVTAETLGLITKCDYATMFYGLSGKEEKFMGEYRSDRLFVVSNDKVETAVSSILDATTATNAIKYEFIIVTYADKLNSLQNTFYRDLSELKDMINLKIFLQLR